MYVVEQPKLFGGTVSSQENVSRRIHCDHRPSTTSPTYNCTLTTSHFQQQCNYSTPSHTILVAVVACLFTTLPRTTLIISYIHTYIHSYIHSYIHTYIHTYIHGAHSGSPQLLVNILTHPYSSTFSIFIISCQS